MNVSFKNIDAASGIMKLEIVKADYAEQVDKNLRSFRQKANVPGFRKGMVPMSMVKKMYGKHVLIEEVNKLVSENLFKYIRENDLKILGEPMPNETEQAAIDFDKQEEFEFYFDVALSPEIEIELSKDDKLPFYQIVVGDDMVDQQIETYTTNFGYYDSVEEIEEKDLVKGTIAELENGSPKEGGIVVAEAVLMPSYMKDDAEKAKFIGSKVNSVVVFNPSKAYEGSDVEISSLLKVEKEAVPALTGDFSFEITEITRHTKSELDQELFDKVFGPDVVSSEEEFKDKVKSALAEQFVSQSDYKFLLDAREMLVEKAGEVKFSDALLKRWLLAKDQDLTPEKLEEEYPSLTQNFIYQLIKDSLMEANGLTVEEGDIESFTKKVAKAQFAQYGMLAVPDEVLGKYAMDMLKNKQTLQNIYDRVVEQKLASWLKEQVELDVKELTIEEFNKLLE